MSTATKHLVSRWQQEWQHYQQEISEALLKSKKLSSLDLPKTQAGLLDLRGYSAPKEYAEMKKNSGEIDRFVSGRTGIRKQIFESADLSGSDFEMCAFENCLFTNCIIEEVNFSDASFQGCEFDNTWITKTNLRHSSFNTSGIIFTKRKINFRNTIFDNTALSKSFFTKQGLDNCQFIDCKTTLMHFGNCQLNNVKFTGRVKEVFFEKCSHQNTDMREAQVESLSLINQPIEGILFPEGDSYYSFTNKTKELSQVDCSQLDKKKQEEIEFIKKVWLDRNPEADFADINYFDPAEKETGKWLIRQLKENALMKKRL